jgi:hypothetical protein
LPESRSRNGEHDMLPCPSSGGMLHNGLAHESIGVERRVELSG